jgi:hypothetical protein
MTLIFKDLKLISYFIFHICGGTPPRTKSHLWCDSARSERDSSGTTEARNEMRAKVMERIARRERPKGAKRLAQIKAEINYGSANIFFILCAILILFIE